MFKISQTDDHELIAEMDAQAFEGCELARSEIERITWWVARNEDGLPVAYAGARPCKTLKGTVFLSRCAVTSCARGQGLQRRLLEVRVRWARKHDAWRAITYTASDNWRSMNNLIRKGFTTYKDAYVGDDFVYWQKSLTL